ncbi:PIG-L family deacetylase [Candidatus Woesearchaeota archaeon]|jgi:LmbE family N-acetylglucosaminyl deacetylase|nr:PIG-L family deacetylase [Candidatus Woesearchaeota archaeon]MBT7367921.1 PIG-L family deacetylase [Candidatus Woesearchaeota archaeon]
MVRIPKKDKVLVICAHPDDEILGVGGTIAKYKQEGKYNYCIIFSFGEKSHWWMKKKYTVEMRVAESKKAAEIVGYDETFFLGLKDADLKSEIERPEVLEKLANLIKKINPGKIFTHSMDDVIYADHKSVHSAVIQALDDIKYRGEVYTFNIWAKDVRTTANPKLYVDISDTFNLKIKALKIFVSQKLALMQLLPTIYYKAIRSGITKKMRFAEVFIKIK